jgi:threonine/homoserine/homoserine lactone efflux protein
LITNLLNPKAAVFYVAILPTFLDPSPSIHDAIILSAIYVLVATLIHGAIVTLAGFLRPLFSRSRMMAATGKLFAVALIGVAAWLAWATR